MMTIYENKIKIALKGVSPVVVQITEPKTYSINSHPVVFSISAFMQYGAKSSAVDEGDLGQTSYDDDYLYFCTTAGTAGNAIWKKIPMLRT